MSFIGFLKYLGTLFSFLVVYLKFVGNVFKFISAETFIYMGIGILVITFFFSKAYSSYYKTRARQITFKPSKLDKEFLSLPPVDLLYDEEDDKGGLVIHNEKLMKMVQDVFREWHEEEYKKHLYFRGE